MEKALFLLVDSPDNCERITQIVKNINVIQVHTGEEALKILTENFFDCLILGHSLPDYDGITLVKRIRELKYTLPIVLSSDCEECSVPIVVVYEQGYEGLAAKVLEAGAQGCVSKNNADKFLLPTINSIINNYRLISGIKYYKNFYDNAPIGFFSTVVGDGTFLRANEAMKNILEVESVEGLKARELYPGSQAAVRDRLVRMVQQGPVKNFEAMLTLPNGKQKWVSLTCKLCKGVCHLEGKCIYNCPSVRCMEGSCTDISDRKRLEGKLKEFEKKELEKLKELRIRIEKKLNELTQ